jgi:hypothetical protein
MIKVWSLIAVVMCMSLRIWAQQIKELQPEVGIELRFDKNEEKLIKRRDMLLSKDKRTSEEEAELQKLLEKYDESVSNIWETVGGGCSWYCGGGPYKIKASSHLEAISGVTYNADNIHDFSYKTVWAEGVDGYGVGESITYYFQRQSPRVTEVLIANGYVKTDKAWSDNARVKRLKMYVNGKPYAILNLKDVKKLQSFKVGTIGRDSKDKDWTIKFEILEVYKGSLYEDTVISEIYFDGIDVH